MTHAQLEKLRGHLADLRQVLARSHGGWADYESLLEFRRLCWACLAADDRECHEHIDLLVKYARELYSESDHQRWGVGPLLGIDVLRRKIDKVLGAFGARLDAIERALAARGRGLRAA